HRDLFPDHELRAVRLVPARAVTCPAAPRQTAIRPYAKAALHSRAALFARGAAWCLPRVAGRGLGPAAHWFGGRERPPYRAAETVGFPANPARRKPLPGGMYASPTNIRDRVHEPNTFP